MPYPMWTYFPRNARPEEWALGLVESVERNRSTLDTTEVSSESVTKLTSDAVLEVLRPAMEELGFKVESGKSRGQRIERPVLFGDNGRPEVKYEIDAFHDELGIAVEVEAGRGAMSNAAYRDIIRTSLLLDANYFVLMMPIEYRYQSSGRVLMTEAFAKTRDQLSAIYASRRLRLPFAAVLLIGY
ncbi:hypothetical protein [Curtobacterium flaccumfaciens]|uniref:hypothetical protein n=1 Tax=Curtobacterium flaccumfaciens TaxID=2035 RepID=UPI001BDE1F70|nr:hypothetical protein [Curtobacterium flaccumfaciens]MBT1607879.1 hypothetical protein [Curtobacterium flaccumfaciens pv. betae]MBT1657857.1 hypothetical protein [Curtobacterium flaccumfaciens pv. betae]MCS0470187.1 hypothetical protein [Curtobacterium flaccumfaciens pv. betae]MCS0475405.1 hypothetical protein [Curtobacterium flaccumfaciens pv. betae]MCS0477036.1 hypothetical protein [Curtobacterium flaccumfaciens pv. betae]